VGIVPLPDNSLVGYGQAITDAQENAWTITANGRVAVNGVSDPATADVTHLAYVNGVVWQENASNLWWSKTSPAAVWNPPDGTPAVSEFDFGHLLIGRRNGCCSQAGPWRGGRFERRRIFPGKEKEHCPCRKRMNNALIGKQQAREPSPWPASVRTSAPHPHRR
jgi:hypothetical protein